MSLLVHLQAIVQSPLGKFSGKVTKEPVLLSEVETLQRRFIEDVYRNNEFSPKYVTLSADRAGTVGTFVLPMSILRESIVLFRVVPHDQPSFEGFLNEDPSVTSGQN